MSSPTHRGSLQAATRPRTGSCCGNAQCHHQAHQQLQQFRYELYLEMRLAMQHQHQHHEQTAAQLPGSKHDHRVARSLLSELEETETEDDGSSGEDVREQKPRAGSDSEGSVTSDGSNADAVQHLHLADGLSKAASASSASSASSSAASVASTLSPLSPWSASSRSESCCSSAQSSTSSSASPAEPSTVVSRPSAAVEVLSAADDDSLLLSNTVISPFPSFPFTSPPTPAAYSSPSPTPGRSTPHFSLLSSASLPLPALPPHAPDSDVQSPLLVLSEYQALRLQSASVSVKPPLRQDVTAAPVPALLSIPNSPPVASSPRSLMIPPSPSTPSSPSSSSPSAGKTIIVRSTYLLTAVDSAPVAAGGCFLSLNLTASDSSPRGLQLVEGETVTRHIDMQRIVSCSAGADDAHVVSVLYQRVVAASASDSPSSSEEKESWVQESAEFRLSSLMDAQHVRALIAALVSASPASSALGRVVPSVKGQQCVLKGWIEHQTGSSSGSEDGDETPPVWARRFARLYGNRLLFFRTAHSPLPVHVVPLSCDGPESRAMASSPAALQVRLDCCNGDSGSRAIVWRCQDEQTHQDWLQALQADAPPPPATLSAPATPVRKRSISERSESQSSTSPSSACSSSSMPLSALIGSQRSFMAYLLELSALRPLCPSSLPSAAAFQLLTPTARLRKRQAALCGLDSALLSYHHLLAALFSIWCEARLLMVDRLEQSGSGQIGFSFPGFDTQVFDVGKLCVIACGQLLSPQTHALLFTARDFQLAMESSSPAKEMMQSSPDITQLFARGERDEARALAAQSQRLLLHHCALASHVKSHQAELRAGDVLVWEEVMATVGSRSSNTAVLDMYRPVSYVFNPALTALHSLIAQVKGKRKTETATSYASFPAAISYAMAAAVALPVKSSPTHTRSASASTSPSTSPVQPSSPAAASTSRGFFSRVMSSPSKSTPPVSPSSGLSKSSPSSPRLAVSPPPASLLSPIALTSPAVSSPTVPALLPAAAASSLPVADLRCLADPLHLLLLLRTLLHYRRHALSSLLAAITTALQSMKAVPSFSPSDVAAVQSLQAEAEKEREAVMTALSALPRQEEIELEERRERRERRERKEEQEARRFMRGKSGTVTGTGSGAAGEEKEDREGPDVVSTGRRHPDELGRAIVVLTLQEREASGG